MPHGLVMSETDYGSKKKAKKATERTPQKATDEARLQLELFWQKLVEDAYALCPKETGALADTIRTETNPVETAGGFERIATVHQLINKRLVAGGQFKKGKFVNYAQAVHDGHVSPTGKFVPPQPFLEDAIAMNSAELDRIIKRIGDKIVEDWGRD